VPSLEEDSMALEEAATTTTPVVEGRDKQMMERPTPDSSLEIAVEEVATAEGGRDKLQERMSQEPDSLVSRTF